MPELPEVEIIRREIRKVLINKRFLFAQIYEPRSIIKNSRRLSDASTAENAFKKLKGKLVLDVLRKGKILTIKFESGNYLAIHLKMTGNLLIRRDLNEEICPKKYLRATLCFEDIYLDFCDIRKFGYLEILSEDEMSLKLKKIGPDVLLDVKTGKELLNILKKTRKPIKQALIDQALLAGIGNAYADEILYDAGLNPLRNASSLKEVEVEKLFQSMKKKIEEGIKYGGLTLRDYRNPYGNAGEFQNYLRIYGKLDKKCQRCSGKVERVKIQGRSTYFCNNCQK
ncbi:MAG: bifunctional DNA-formamidopyrimidine glycosylase/DNA-(apurinic or apyrimidinic site) lyase [Actinobacteria bacterium]|nr:bifunctional DNA-formamidopyrimidine glycosylase/DNA-(apurinic or apyrimidinic site) lyase [Actinomycetota bacterium]